MNKINYQKELDKLIAEFEKEGQVPSLLLHSCCGPCSSYCIEYLSQFFSITVFYYNPNIYPDEEYYHRVKEQQRFINEFPAKHKVSFIEGDYDTDRFYEMAKGLENEPEKGARCHKCYDLRLRRTAEVALEKGFDFFTTTLTISPMKDSQILNEIGFSIAEELGARWLPSDFKKKEGYKRSTELSREYNMYRQDYCGCVYSYRDRQQQKANEMED
ncbi:epoxyqueuosine reductase QueH [Pseudobutyrivibrio sp.]|uniref:epoxyqueuosine reductase QueH n=1 Tax=Pseudobutyrivibrio sp. TaxID=2014367 RepID=UPI001B54437C|nr:epoxyqueuosine reductase QueH [Pseudobutyrivibrio sp.]MBP5593797.1 epoxyqueuosine reductase QueH [Pseudobutyrivibrio sp.]MBQ7470038.1 epoxyqueuosine reductase QueH [Pseudobutyrivibrio sp.]MBR5649510.1 epoxyqueuosine reductase QueH [Pseudobutyrivibrio sp.]